MGKYVTPVVLAVAALSVVLLSALLVLAVNDRTGRPEGPSCPTEDSCSIDYRDGGWFIDGVRVTR